VTSRSRPFPAGRDRLLFGDLLRLLLNKDSLARRDDALFESLMAIEHCLHGLINGEIRAHLTSTRFYTGAKMT
jgi:hypothetical protein